MAGDEDAGGTFLRETSGVTRNVRLRDTFLYNIGIINVAVGITFILFVIGFYPKVSVVGAIAITTVGGIINALVYYYFSSIMPRSGGQYIYISRTIHPSIGFMVSFNMVVQVITFAAVLATYMSGFGLSTLAAVLSESVAPASLYSLAVSLSPPAGSFLSASTLTFAVGAVVILFFGWLVATGNKRVFAAQNIGMLIAWLGVFALVVVLFMTPRETFVANFNQFTRAELTYQQVVDTAKANGMTNAPNTLWATLKFAVWPFYFLAFGALSSVFAGEIRDVQRTQFLGTWTSTVTVGLSYIVIYLGTVQLMGYDFIAAIGYNFFVDPAGTTAVFPWVGLLGAIAASNQLLSLVIALGFLMWTWFWIPQQTLFAARVMFAWSIDRMVPDRFGEVSTKYNTPMFATIVSVVGVLIALAFYTFGGALITRVLVGIGAIALGYIVFSIAAIVFPYTNREMYEQSDVSDHAIAGVPVMSIVGVINLVWMSFVTYFFFSDPLIGQSDPLAIGYVVGVYVTGLLVYLVMRTYRRQQDVDLDEAFDEIPVE
jgi:amino acid transporter